MVQVRLNFDLSKYVILDFHLFYSLLRHLFNNADKANIPLLSHINISKCTFTQFLKKLKVTKLDLSLRPGVSSLFCSQWFFLARIFLHRYCFETRNLGWNLKSFLLFELKARRHRTAIIAVIYVNRLLHLVRSLGLRSIFRAFNIICLFW